MVLTLDDLPWKLSVTTGSAGSSSTSSPAQSLGRYISTTAWDQGSPRNNLFDDISGDENYARNVEYRCVFIQNDHASLSLETPAVYLESEIPGGADVGIGLDPTPNSPAGASSAQALFVPNDSSAPAGVAFSAPTTRMGGLAFPDLAPGYCRAVWVRRTATDSGPLGTDGFRIAVQGDSDG